MAFSVSSNGFKHGDYLPNEFILSADFGMGCPGNKPPHLKINSSAAIGSFNLHFNTLARAEIMGLVQEVAR